MVNQRRKTDRDSTATRGTSAGENTRKFDRSWQCSGCKRLLIIAIEVAVDADALADQRWIRCPACKEAGWLAFPIGERVVSVVVTNPQDTASF